MHKKNELTTSKCIIAVIAPHIVENRVLDGQVLEVDDIIELKQVNLELTGGKEYAVLASFGHLSEVSKESRELIASKAFAQNTVAKALLVTNIGHRLVSNFYLSVNRPYIKTKVFTDRNPAIEWLSNELNKSI